MDLNKLDLLRITTIRSEDERIAKGIKVVSKAEGEITDIEEIVITIPTDDVMTALITDKDKVKRYIISRIDISPIEDFVVKEKN